MKKVVKTLLPVHEVSVVRKYLSADSPFPRKLLGRGNGRNVSVNRRIQRPISIDW